MPLKPEINNNPSTFPGKIAAEKKKKWNAGNEKAFSWL